MKKSIIKNIKNVMVLALCTATMSSCLLDDEKTDFGKGDNLVGFSSPQVTLSAPGTGLDIESSIPVQIIGPTVNKLSGDVTVNVSLDPSSTAIEGTHFNMTTNTITLSPEGEDLYTGSLPITIITEGIEVPYTGDAPVIVLNITDISTSENIVINDKTKQVAASISYSCAFDITNYEGTYLATTDEFGIYLSQPVPFEVVAGPGEYQITLVNVAAHPEAYDVIVDVNPENGDLTITDQTVLNYNNFGSTQYGELSWDGSGTSTAGGGHCIGTLEVTNGYFVAAGTFGQFKTVFEKQ
jgi:hypothetical protein